MCLVEVSHRRFLLPQYGRQCPWLRVDPAGRSLVLGGDLRKDIPLGDGPMGGGISGCHRGWALSNELISPRGCGFY